MGTLGLMFRVFLEEDGRVAFLLEQSSFLFLSRHSNFLSHLQRDSLLPAIISTMFEHSLHKPLMLLILFGRHLGPPQDDMHLGPLHHLLLSEAFLSFQEAPALNYPRPFQVHSLAILSQDAVEEVSDQFSLQDPDGSGSGVVLEPIFLLRVVTQEEDGHLLVHLPTVLDVDDPAIGQLERSPLAELATSQEEDL